MKMDSTHGNEGVMLLCDLDGWVSTQEILSQFQDVIRGVLSHLCEFNIKNGLLISS